MAWRTGLSARAGEAGERGLFAGARLMRVAATSGIFPRGDHRGKFRLRTKINNLSLPAGDLS